MNVPVQLLASVAALCCLAAGATSATAQDQPRRHAMSLIGEPKFGPDFKHFDWVNPKAPKGGVVRQYVMGTFDSLNAFSDKGVTAGRLGAIYDSLMTPSPDEPSTGYGLVAEWASYPPDFSSVTFGLRKGARFHDGRPITPEDVVFSLEALKTASPRFALYYKNVVKAEKTGEREVTFTFDKSGNRELPMIVGELVVLPKHFYEGKKPNGEPRDITKTFIDEIPLGSGAYKIKSFEPGRSIVYERVADYWAKDLPVMLGQWNFDEMRLVYFRDRDPAFEYFKSGKLDIWIENSASAWASRYDFDAVKTGLVLKEAIPVKRVAPMQAFAFNLRRKQFQDPRVRQAFNLAYNFEEANKNLFYGLYVRVGSYFENSELKATGLPEGRESELLQEVKDQVPPEVFTTEWKNPVNAAPGDYRKNQQAAMKLLEAAGWTLREETVDDPDCGVFCKTFRTIGLVSAKTERILRNAQGETLNAEFLIDDPQFDRIILPYVQALRALGINATLRVVVDAQYQRRENTHDYDIIIDNFAQSLSPGNEQRDFWGSAAADMQGSRNTIGIKNAAIDHLIDKIVFATNRDELVAACRALDRVLLWNHYVVPHWHYPFERVVSWNIFGRPEILPSQTSAPLQVWWIDPEKQKSVAAVQR